MLGALEVKKIVRMAAARGAAWKTVHSAVMSCLLAHHNRQTGHCWPDRKLIATFCCRSVRTVDRIIVKLVAWGCLEKQQPKALASGQFRPCQYALPLDAVRHPDVRRPYDTQVSDGRTTKSASAVRQ